MKKKNKKLNENDYLKSISNIVDLFYENRRLKRNITKAIEYIKENTTDPEFVVSGELQEHQVIELLKILKGE